MKHYKKFYEIGNNRYYTIVADDEMYIATESFLTIKKRIFRKPKELNNGFKSLKFSPCIGRLFMALDELEPTKNQKYDDEDLITYNHIDNRKLKEDIKNSYFQTIQQEIEIMKSQQADYINDDDLEHADICADYIRQLENLNPMDGIDLNSPEHTGCNIVKTMIREGLEHLYTERITAFANNIYLYEQDDFGTLTIYRVTTVKNVVKTIETFIYDKKLVETLLKTLYEEGR